MLRTREFDLKTSSQVKKSKSIVKGFFFGVNLTIIISFVIDSYEDIPETFGENWLCSSSIVPPLEISVTEEELRLLRWSYSD